MALDFSVTVIGLDIEFHEINSNGVCFKKR
jgi:hypothetical protein